MIKRIILLISLLGCYISSTGVLAEKGYRDEDGVKEEDEFVASRISIKQPSSNNKRSYSRPSITRRRCGKGSGKGGGIGGCIKDDETSSLAGTSTVGTSTGGEAEGQEMATLGKTSLSSLV